MGAHTRCVGDSQGYVTSAWIDRHLPQIENMNRELVNRLSWTAQQGDRAMTYNKPVFGALAMLPLLGLLGLTGCNQVLPATLEETLATTGTADDHLMAARLYLNKMRELEAEAVEYETAVSKQGHSGHSKDFHYAALRMAAQQKRSDANQMRALYATHLEQAQSLHDKAQAQQGPSDRKEIAHP